MMCHMLNNEGILILQREKIDCILEWKQTSKKGNKQIAILQ